MKVVLINGTKRTVNARLGELLVKRGKAMLADDVASDEPQSTDESSDSEQDETLDRKSRRKYKRRDMRAED